MTEVKVVQDEKTNTIRQWAIDVLAFSSEYNESQSAKQVIGQPAEYPEYGDLSNTWCQSLKNADEFIELLYEKDTYVSGINIYETYNCGGVIRIKIKNYKDSVWETVWEAANGAEQIEHSRIFSPELRKTNFRTREVRIEVDCTVSGSYCEIDAVELVGQHFLIDQVNCEKTLSLNLVSLLESGEFSDVQFEVEGKILKGHRNIFASRSMFFKNILCDNTKADSQKPVHIENISHSSFKSLMYYLYSGVIEKGTDARTVCELIRISEWYDLETLDEVGYLYIKENLSLENVLGILVCATQTEPHLEQVERACLKYLAKNFNLILNNPEFKNLDKNIVLKIAQFYGQFFQKKV